jgi:phosphohistidine phosphatase
VDLILWRHAEAEEGAPDHERELTAKGNRQAEKIAAFLRPNLPGNLRILVSPATDNFTLAPDIAPGASPQAVLQAAQWPNVEGAVLIVGHQPTLGAVAAQLLGCEGSAFSIKKGGIWWFSQRAGSAQVSLRLVIAPDFL